MLFRFIIIFILFHLVEIKLSVAETILKIKSLMKLQQYLTTKLKKKSKALVFPLYVFLLHISGNVFRLNILVFFRLNILMSAG